MHWRVWVKRKSRGEALFLCIDLVEIFIISPPSLWKIVSLKCLRFSYRSDAPRTLPSNRSCWSLISSIRSAKKSSILFVDPKRPTQKGGGLLWKRMFRVYRQNVACYTLPSITATVRIINHVLSRPLIVDQSFRCFQGFTVRNFPL